jgi:choline dehydrogenase-like flavoprotein
MDDHYDIIIIGSGAGGGTLAYQLASTGKKILILERGDFLAREKENWDPRSMFVTNRYLPDENWYDTKGNAFQPGEHYYVGGKTKFYGAAHFRLREADFHEIKHQGGISPSWPIKYDELKDYYYKAEQLYHTHGKRGIDPTDPPDERDYPYPAISNEPLIEKIYQNFRAGGINASPLPLGLKLKEDDMRHSPCIRCDTCDGYPCLIKGKSDAEVMCVLPALKHPNVSILTNAKALKLLTDPSGKRVTAVEVDLKGKKIQLSADVFSVSCGAINSAALLLRSANDKHPNGLANSSDCVGRHYMCHINTVLSTEHEYTNDTSFEKTFCINDFYHKGIDVDYPLGGIQLLGNIKEEMFEPNVEKWTRFFMRTSFREIARHSVGWWLTTEDLPTPEQRITLNSQGDIVVNYKPNNNKAHEFLYKAFKRIHSKHIGHKRIHKNMLYLHESIGVAGVAHQAGTCRFGIDPKSSVLDLNCKAHDLENLYVVDTSFFPSIGAVNPSLTAIANAIRVSEHLAKIL